MFPWIVILILQLSRGKKIKTYKGQTMKTIWEKGYSPWQGEMGKTECCSKHKKIKLSRLSISSIWFLIQHSVSYNLIWPVTPPLCICPLPPPSPNQTQASCPHLKGPALSSHSINSLRCQLLPSLCERSQPSPLIGWLFQQTASCFSPRFPE